MSEREGENGSSSHESEGGEGYEPIRSSLRGSPGGRGIQSPICGTGAFGPHDAETGKAAKHQDSKDTRVLFSRVASVHPPRITEIGLCVVHTMSHL